MFNREFPEMAGSSDRVVVTRSLHLDANDSGLNLESSRTRDRLVGQVLDNDPNEDGIDAGCRNLARFDLDRDFLRQARSPRETGDYYGAKHLPSSSGPSGQYFDHGLPQRTLLGVSALHRLQKGGGEFYFFV